MRQITDQTLREDCLLQNIYSFEVLSGCLSDADLSPSALDTVNALIAAGEVEATDESGTTYYETTQRGRERLGVA